MWNDPLHPPRGAPRVRAVCFIDGSVPRRAGSTPARRLAINIHSQLTPIRAVGNAPGPLAPRTSAHPVAQQNLLPHGPGTPCRRISPSAAHLHRPVHAARLLHPPCSCGLACAPRRAAFGDPFEYGHHPGGYRYLLFELRTHDYATLLARALCPCRLRARARCCAPSCVHVLQPLAGRFSGVRGS